LIKVGWESGSQDDVASSKVQRKKERGGESRRVKERSGRRFRSIKGGKRDKDGPI